MPLMRKFILALLLALVLLPLAALVYAPYLPRLLAEGYPSLVWPVRGHFAAIEGAVAQPPALSAKPSRQPSAELLTLFNDSGGKALLVSRAGRLELEHYAAGITAETKLNSFSMAKSLVGALVFKALAEGRLKSLDESIGGILPDHGDAAFRTVTPRALLRMQSGILFDASDKILGGEPKDVDATRLNPFGPMARLHMGGLAAIASSLTVTKAASQPFSYQNIDTAILGAALERLYAKPLEALLSEKLWRPAGAAPAFWRRPYAQGPASAYCCIFARPRDWIAVGRYLMHNGEPGKPFLPDPLWRELMGADLGAAALRQGVFGHHLRHDILDRPGEALHGAFAYMLGQGGQVLYMLPKEDLVVLRSGERIQRLHSTLYAAWRSLAPASSP